MKSRSQSKFGNQTGEIFQEVLSRRIARRSFLKGALLTAPVLVLGPGMLNRHPVEAAEGDGLGFQPIALDNQDRVLVAPGYDAKVLIRWGDPVFKSSPDFDPFNQNKLTQEHQFGYNCDYVAYLALPDYHSNNPGRALLWVNHEYTNEAIMFPKYDVQEPTLEQVDVALAAHGGTVIEIRRDRRDGWEVVTESFYNRRITGETEMEITGPAAGDDMMKVSYDPDGKRVRGMFNNCGGGTTPGAPFLPARKISTSTSPIERTFRTQMSEKQIIRAMACPSRRANEGGSYTTIVSISRKTRMNPFASAGWWKSIPTILILFQKNAPL